jgi:sulfonate transport system substrate-binding protein
VPRTTFLFNARTVIAGGLVAVILAACGSTAPATSSGGGSTSGTSPNSPGATGSVGAAPPGATDLSGVTLKVATYPVAIGSDETLLRAAGLLDTPYKVEFQTYPDTGTQTSAVLQGTADISRGSGVANALLAGGSTTALNFRSIATLKISTATQWTVAKPDITSLEQLKGKKVAYTPNSTAQYFLLKQLGSVGLTFNDIDPVPLAPANGLSALLGGSVDALSNFGATVQTAVAKGYPVLADGGPILKGTLGALVASYNANTDALKDPAKAAAIADYLARVDTANAWTRAHADDWAKTVATATNQPIDTVKANFKLAENTVNSSVGPVDPAAVADEQSIADAFLTAGVLKSKVDIAATYSDQLNAQIAAAIEHYKAQRAADFTVTTVN